MKSLYSIPFFLTLLLAAFFVEGCKDSVDITSPASVNNSQTQTFMAVAERSASINSFTPNYNEEQAMTLAGSLAKDLYPIKVGQKMTLIDKSLTLTKDSTTAVGTLVQNFEGKLIIQGSFQQPTIGLNSRVDTTVEKTFNTTITRKIKFERVKFTGNDTLDWKVAAVSLPNGGSEGTNIAIAKIRLTTQDGNEVVIDDPNSYFFKVGKERPEDNDAEDNDNHDFDEHLRGWGQNWKNLLTWYGKNQNVKLTVEVLSASSAPDFLTVTFGAMMNGMDKKKNKFNLVSTTQEGLLYRKVYESSCYTKSNAVKMHAVINAMPRNAVYDTDTAVEVKTWGIPYRVR